MRATPAEARATEYLRTLAARRFIAYAMKRRTDGTWRGVLFSLGVDPQLVCLSRATRGLLVEALTRVVTSRWPLKTGRPATREAA